MFFLILGIQNHVADQIDEVEGDRNLFYKRFSRSPNIYNIYPYSRQEYTDVNPLSYSEFLNSPQTSMNKIINSAWQNEFNDRYANQPFSFPNFINERYLFDEPSIYPTDSFIPLETDMGLLKPKPKGNFNNNEGIILTGDTHLAGNEPIENVEETELVKITEEEKYVTVPLEVRNRSGRLTVAATTTSTQAPPTGNSIIKLYFFCASFPDIQ